MIRFVVCQFGYVESTRLAHLVCAHPVGFDTEKQALEDLAGELLDVYKDRAAPKPANTRACCKKAMKVESNEFCPKCGSGLKDIFDTSLFHEWLGNLVSEDIDSYGGDNWAGGRALRWDIGASPIELIGTDSDDVIDLYENAADSLLAAIGLENDE